MLILYQAVAYIAFQCFTQYPLNILADFYGGAQKISGIYSTCAIVGILVQIVLVSFIAKMKSIKAFGSVLGAITLVLMLIYKPASIKALDDKFRTSAGKPLDDALANRK